LGVYSVRTFRQEKTVYQSAMRNHQITVYMQYKEGEAAPNPMETMLSALSSCKLVNFWDLAEKYKIAFDDASIEITAVVGSAGVVEGTHQPRNDVKSIHTTWSIKSNITDEEIEEYLKIVDGTCTVGLSMNPSIEFTHEIKRS
jgi:uncharacterized OsmC-like protein